ncbi:FtsK/SpoIIIE domain-containing protein [Streptomyces sp. A3M-1-3]|uniref:FtsK/SpoIIIE domain-containing protein n=1 Tax=Streptomyces sp. A3M-1-3 TaxID=2962044 RepID=UPI0020B772DB|nr:FtsK/SpoIIIE domain-containing protein [Streptomyces sp. A3M-1-3]MCP3820087.1 FtsK/SpoIIIE domain-containing protein [Streptomyces sp. A3M-1-3]
MTTTDPAVDDRLHVAKDIDAGIPVTFLSRLALRRRVTDANTQFRRAFPAIAGTARYTWWGLVGSAKCVRGVWRWLTAAEYEIHREAKPELVERTRARRRKTIAWTLTPTSLAYGTVAWIYHPWPLAGLAALGLSGFAAAAISEKRARQATLDVARKKTGKLPGSKVVRQAFADSKLGEVRIVGVIARTDTDDAWVALIELAAGMPASKVMTKREELASALGVGVELLDCTPVVGHAGRIKVTCFDKDPMQGPPIPTPLLQKPQVNLWTDRIPVGINLRGRIVDVALPERSVLIGGEPGAGKSVAAMNLLLAVALDPEAQLWLGDGKGVDTLDLEPLAKKVAPSASPAGLLDMLQELRVHMDERFKVLRKLGKKKVEEGLDLPLIVLWIDELARYTTDPKFKKEIIEALRDVIQRGRASGIVTVCATQRPSGDVVPTSIRDLLSIRLALRSTTNAASDTILGQGRAAAGYSAAAITAAQRGVGYLLDEGTDPVILRNFFVNPAQERQIIERGYSLRETAGTLALAADHPRRKMLTLVVEAFGEQDRLSTEVLLERLGGDWDPASLARGLALDGYPKALWIDGATKQGYARSAVVEALDGL